MTAEARLWQALKGRGGPVFQRQAWIGGHMVDFVCQEARLIVEVDVAPLRTKALRAASAARTRELKARGYRILRLWADHIETHLEGTVAIIEASLKPPQAVVKRAAPRRGRSMAPLAA